jgi:16S rRNA (guanine966-N2)-methyltransferase
MRVIAGKYRSRPLQSLKGVDIRPTSDRLRETLFNVLCGGNAEALTGTVWCDLYAGTGAVGIEALSRGAGFVHFVEESSKAAALIERNLKSLGIAENYKILKSDVVGAIRKLQALDGKADFVFVDPPYRMEAAYQQTLGMLAQSRLVKPSALVMAEHDRRFDPGEEFGQLRRYRLLKQGDSGLSFYRLE